MNFHPSPISFHWFNFSINRSSISRSKVCPDAGSVVDFGLRSDARLTIDLRHLGYNYHKTFVQISLYDNTRGSAITNRSER